MGYFVYKTGRSLIVYPVNGEPVSYIQIRALLEADPKLAAKTILGDAVSLKQDGAMFDFAKMEVEAITTRSDSIYITFKTDNELAANIDLCRSIYITNQDDVSAYLAANMQMADTQLIIMKSYANSKIIQQFLKTIGVTITNENQTISVMQVDQTTSIARLILNQNTTKAHMYACVHCDHIWWITNADNTPAKLFAELGCWASKNQNANLVAESEMLAELSKCVQTSMRMHLIAGAQLGATFSVNDVESLRVVLSGDPRLNAYLNLRTIKNIINQNTTSGSIDVNITDHESIALINENHTTAEIEAIISIYVRRMWQETATWSDYTTFFTLFYKKKES